MIYHYQHGAPASLFACDGHLHAEDAFSDFLRKVRFEMDKRS